MLLSGCGRSDLSPLEMKIDDVPVDEQIVPGESTYVASGKETLFEIAYRHNVDPMNLAQINNIKAPYKIKSGQILRLPVDTAPEAAAGTIAVVDVEDKSIRSYEDNNIRSYEEDEKNPAVPDTKNDKVVAEFEKMIDAETPESKKQAQKLSKPKIIQENANTSPKKSSDTSPKKSSDTSPKKSSDTSPKKSSDASPKKSSDGKLQWPLKGKIISEFGDVNNGVSNDGINIKAAVGTKIKAADAGTVIRAETKSDEDFGNVVVIQHESGLTTFYTHLKDVNVKEGAVVNAGDVIGSVGNTGDVSEPQLFFGVMKDKKLVNPNKFLKKQPKD
jgi:murein DD-endopeptidase MepM/ murein hydrolase activator NlpD